MKLLKLLAQKRAARRERRFWQNYRAARNCERGFCLVVVGYIPEYQLTYRRSLGWRVRDLLSGVL